MAKAAIRWACNTSRSAPRLSCPVGGCVRRYADARSVHSYIELGGVYHDELWGLQLIAAAALTWRRSWRCGAAVSNAAAPLGHPSAAGGDIERGGIHSGGLLGLQLIAAAALTCQRLTARNPRHECAGAERAYSWRCCGLCASCVGPRGASAVASTRALRRRRHRAWPHPPQRATERVGHRS